MKRERRTIRHAVAIHRAWRSLAVWYTSSLSGPVGIIHSDRNRRIARWRGASWRLTKRDSLPRSEKSTAHAGFPLAGDLAGFPRLGVRQENGLWPYRSIRGARPFGSRRFSIHRRVVTSPQV